MPVESLFPRLEPLLPRVQKPIQYVGGELNATVKDWGADDETVRWALMYPDAYEVGLPNQGVQILYEILNERDGVLAERTYAVWPDLEALMREHRIGQFTVDAHRPVAAFDLLGVSFATELGYTNMLTALDLAGSRWRPSIGATSTRWSSPGDMRRSTRNRSPTSSMPPCSAMASRPSSRSPTSFASGSTRVARVAATGCCCGSPRVVACTSRGSTTCPTSPTVVSSGSFRTAPASRGRSASTRSWTWTPGRIRGSHWSRWPRPCTSGSVSRSSAAAPGAAGSAKPA